MDNPQVSARVSPMVDTVDTDAPSDPQLREAYETIQEGYRRTKEQTRRLFQNRPQSWRHLLGLLCGVHFSTLAGRLGTDLIFHGQLNVLPAAAVAVSLATRITWHALFLNPYSFLGYRRPGVHYRWAVRIVSFVTTIPALILHLAMIRVASRFRRPLSIDFGQTILQLVLLLSAISLYIWMVRRFLLRQNDEHYEPTVSPSPHEENMNSSPRVADTGDVSSGLNSSTSYQSQSNFLLSKVYAQQQQQQIHRRARNESCSLLQTVEPTMTSETSPPGVPDLPENTSLPRNRDQSPSPHHCQTIAWFDYMPDSRLSDPLISLTLGVYAIIVAWLVYMLIQENSLSKLPSPKAKGGLYAPLGVLLLCAYGSKRFIHTSFFARIYMSPPHPWVLTSSLWGKPIIRNSEDGSIAAEDPRFRVPIKHRDYIMKYNETASGCDGYWGHRGRERTKDFRIRPAFYRFAFLGWAFYFFAKGSICIFNYPTHAYDDELKRPDLTGPDLERQIRILYLKLKLMVAVAPLGILVIIYTLSCALKLWALWTDAIIKYAPPERTQPERQIQL
ncbi:hypothetical protein B0I37DRAFT_363869 [Chaetomium sp. MPI-CAGE-AT-0009]|nr:hypothetical protein B0I37DRAFT_363869 [Chaetomium sp. MPI-CAGE-AT-0009]